MKKLLNTLYITSEDAYLSLNGETAEVLFQNGEKKNVPLHTIESIVCFSYKGASPALLGKCTANNIAVHFFKPNGQFLASVMNPVNGNVLLRRAQYRVADNSEMSFRFAKNFIYAKIYNSKYVAMRYMRDHPFQVDSERIKKVTDSLTVNLLNTSQANDHETLRGIEGNAAAMYFSVFNEFVLQNKTDFEFIERNRRPPTDRTNALLSFAYSLLANDCASALLSVGLDPYVGFMHTDRSGRKSLALDLMEELRPCFADRMILSLINNRVLQANDFTTLENGAVLLKDEARKHFLSEWQERKREQITHPYLNEKINWGLVPYVQAILLARCLRGDLDQYPPFFWK